MNIIYIKWPLTQPAVTKMSFRWEVTMNWLRNRLLRNASTSHMVVSARDAISVHPSVQLTRDWSVRRSVTSKLAKSPPTHFDPLITTYCRYLANLFPYTLISKTCSNINRRFGRVQFTIDHAQSCCLQDSAWFTYHLVWINEHNNTNCININISQIFAFIWHDKYWCTIKIHARAWY